MPLADPFFNPFVVTATSTATNVISTWTTQPTSSVTLVATNQYLVQLQMLQQQGWVLMQGAAGGTGMCNQQAAQAAEDHVRMVNQARPFTTPEVLAARKRARELLLARLTPEQRETFETNNWFVVIGGKTKRRYRIRDGSLVANIDVLGELPGGGVVHRLCGHLTEHCPVEDHLLGQKLLIEHDEERFLSVANIHR